ncbi:F1-F0 ATPase (N-ATPase) AtpR subunit [Thioclava sp. ES.031]|uniref:N-ATPase subunit AtpR n=1 Tax=Thioclava sp. ES.031 TaxID=1798203 RepID=UPI000BF29374|nr:ATP synthase subunit I [Thioclava sp. ES.031]PFG62308.1 F1-F0 ATPase (N-ATPase) AtpR subunit [Thioclava sp. ES.031]
MSAVEFLIGAGALILGIGVGLLHFTLLRAGTDAMLLESKALKAIALTVLRFGLTIAVLVGCALLGAVPLLAAALGIGIGRMLTLRRARSA